MIWYFPESTKMSLNEIQLNEISFFKKFSCTIKNCPNTCCKGWRVVFDEETYQRYLAEIGKNGWRLRSSIKKMDEEVYFRTSLKQCTFYEKEGTCNLQRTLGTDYMPEVCRRYPRFRQHYGSFAEESLFLSCPEAARLFLEHLDELHYVPSERQITYERWGTNDDELYLRWLCELREEMIAALWDENRSRTQILGQLVAAMKEVQHRCISGGELPDVKELIKKEVVEHEIMHEHKPEEGLFISAQVTDRMLTNGFYHRRLKIISPRLYQLCRLYFKTFDRLTPEQADRRACELRSRLHAENPALDRVLRGYVVYYLQMVFLEVYEDYSFVKKLAGGIMHMHMFELFLALYYEHTNRLTDEELALLLSVYERRGRHNEDVSEGMYEKLYPAL